MALQALWAPETQFQNKNGSLLVFGKIYVQYRGRSQLAKTYRDPDGAYQNTNPLQTDNDGRVLCYADDSFSYTAVVCDFYGNELFSFDPIPCGSAGGGGSASAGTAEHWLGWNGASVAVPSGTETRLRMPAGMDNVDYDGGFLKRIESSGTEMVLEEGLYLVNAVIRFQQSSSDLTNELSNVVIHTRDFESANMQEVGATFRDEAGPDSSSDIHTISLTFIRHASVDDVGSDRLKFAVETPNTWSSCYIQNLQIAKLGSSVNGGGTAEPYDPGQYISIENHVISVTGIDPDSYLTSGDLDGYATEQWVLDKNYITSADIPADLVTSGELAIVSGDIVSQIPSLDGYATEQWVLDKNYITSADVPPIPEDVVTSAELAQVSGAIENDLSDLTSAMTEALADKMDKTSSANFYPRYDNPEGYLTSIPSEYVTETEMSEYVTEHTSAFITSAEVQEYSAGPYIDITDHTISVSPVKSLVAGQNVTISASGDNYVISSVAGHTYSAGQYVSIENDIISATGLQPAGSYASEQYVQDYTSAFVDSTYVSEYVDSQVSGKQDELTFSYDASDKINAINGSALAGGGGGGTTYSAGDNIDITNDVISVTDTSNLIAGANVSITSSGDDYVISSVAGSTYSAGQYISIAGDVISVTGVQPAGSYATQTYVDSSVAGKQDKLTFGYNGDGCINAINSSGIAGGEEGLPISAGPGIAISLVSGTILIETSGSGSYATEEYVDAAVSGKMDATESSAFYPMATNPSGYLVSSDLNGYATQTWSTNNFFPIDGIQIVGSSAEASGANIIYIVSGSNA